MFSEIYGTGMSDIIYVPHRDAVQLRLGQIRVFGNVWHRDVRYKICTAQGCRTDQTRLTYLWHGDAKARRCLIYL